MLVTTEKRKRIERLRSRIGRLESLVKGLRIDLQILENFNSAEEAIIAGVRFETAEALFPSGPIHEIIVTQDGEETIASGSGGGFTAERQRELRRIQRERVENV